MIIIDPAIQNQLTKTGQYSDFDFHFARFIHRISDHKPLELFAVSLLLARTSTDGHACIDLTDMHNSQIPEELFDKPPMLSPFEELVTIIGRCNVVGKPGDFSPLILDGNFLYLYKNWDYESFIAQYLCSRAEQIIVSDDPKLLATLLDRYFPQLNDDISWQRVAAYIAATRKLCVITGGPGTGKTTAMVRILALLCQLEKGNPLRIMLAAPTGKAAARMDEAVRKALYTEDDNQLFKNVTLPPASTIHRLLGTLPHSDEFRRTHDNPLDIDILVIDESSMIDLSLMKHVLAALPDHARLIILGDHDQLASVEAGSVFGDICAPDLLNTFSRPFHDDLFSIASVKLPDKYINDASMLADSIVEFTRTFRFSGRLAECSYAVNVGEPEKAFSSITSGAGQSVSWHNTSDKKHFRQSLLDDTVQGWNAYYKANTLEELFAAFNEFRILCVLRNGPFGVDSINRMIERMLADEKLLFPSGQWYPKMPIMITKNNYPLNLYNGDTGIIFPDPTDNRLKAWFPSSSADSSKAFRSFIPSRLPEYEKAFAHTVHKSQGSEFSSVLLLLPDSDTPILTRELIYTAFTRAKNRVSIYGNEDIFKAGVRRNVERKTGLKRKLWENGFTSNQSQ